MTERKVEQQGQSGIAEYADEAGDVTGTGGEGRRNAQATPPVGEDGVHGRTSTPAPGDDVGVPSDDELARQGGSPNPDTTGEQREPTRPADG